MCFYNLIPLISPHLMIITIIVILSIIIIITIVIISIFLFIIIVIVILDTVDQSAHYFSLESLFSEGSFRLGSKENMTMTVY